MTKQKWFEAIGLKRMDIFRIIMSMVHDRDVADDLTQDTIEYLLSNPPPRKIDSWVNGAIRIVMKWHYNKRGKYIPELLDEPDDILIVPEPSDYVSDIETKVDLGDALEQFTPPEKKVILMRLDGFSWDEITQEVPLMTKEGWRMWYENQALRLLRRFFKKNLSKVAA